MSNLPVEAAEPDPATTSVVNDAPIKTETPAPTDIKTPVDSNGAEGENEPAEDKIEENTKVKVEEVEPEEKPEVKADVKFNKNSNDGPRRNNNHGNKKPYSNNKYQAKNRKFDPSALKETDDSKLIRAQVEFYFSDSNLPGDAHMRKLTGDSANNPVSIKEIASFGRMKRFQPYEAVVAALKEPSALLKYVEIDGEDMVQRKVAYDPAGRTDEEVVARSLYVKGFGEEDKTTQTDLEEFFGKHSTSGIASLRLRRTLDQTFKGSVFVEFNTKEGLDEFLALEEKPTYDGRELEFKSKENYMAGKLQDIKDGKIEPAGAFHKRGRGRGRGGRGSGGDFDSNRGNRRDYNNREDRDPSDWKKRRERDQEDGHKSDRRGGHRGSHRPNRGGRGGRRDNRNNDRNRERNGNGDNVKNEVKAEAAVVNTESSSKRTRDDDGSSEAPAPKKVDSKPDIAAEAS